MSVAGPPPLKGKEEPKGAHKADIKDFEGVKVMANPPDSLTLEGGVTWLLIDQIKILDKEAEDKHALEIKQHGLPFVQGRATKGGKPFAYAVDYSFV